MPTILLNPHRTWLILIIATAATFWVRADGLVGITAGAATLAIAAIKGRLVILDFMELRHAPNPWRSVISGWLMLVTVLLMVVYAFGPSLLAGVDKP
ncbi:cytochrome C oxidase subunit IV family protein [Nevskia ramosa]|uniref:cytochrome C oxidase subunit IV family protein n=1 Tax=Nevskia ramosa TaxID=64002 RepID=UPI0003B74B51|nr:cytochrome C oxidase subunit IV family protein [Nevskia ramosa]